jgi:Pyruvate/2-oxoacid:ferredoxin oxidoreductase delta subunit
LSRLVVLRKEETTMMNDGYGEKGRGMGRGGGRGGGRGNGMRRGRSIGRGFGRGQGGVPPAGSSPLAAKPRDIGQQARVLRAQAQEMMDQLSAINQKIAEIEATGTSPSKPIEKSDTASDGNSKFRKMTAVIDRQRCMNCGLCIDICPEQAIDMNPIVAIDSIRCTGCGSCMKECPNEAIYLSEMMASHAAS